MNNRSIMALAVLAVALMLGSALVPMTFDNGNGTGTSAAICDTTEMEASDDTASVPGTSLPDTTDLYSILSLLFSATGDGSSPSYDVSIMPVPMKNDTDYVNMSNWDGGDVTGSKTVVLYNNMNVTMTGDAHIGSGATFVIFPSAVWNEVSFTLNASSDSGLYLKSGSFLDIFGLKFKIVGESDDSEIELFEVLGKVKVELSISGLSIILGERSSFGILGIKVMNNSDIAETTDTASFKITATNIRSDRDKFKVMGIGIKIGSQTETDYGLMDINCEIAFDSIELSVPESGKIELDAGSGTADNIKVSSGEGEDEIVLAEITKYASPAEKISVEMTASSVKVNEKNALSYSLSIKDSKDGDESIDSIGYLGMGTVKGVKSSCDSMEFNISSDGKKETVGLRINGESSYTIDSVDVKVEGLDISSVPTASIKSLSASTNDLVIDLTSTGEKYDVTMSMASMKLGLGDFSSGTADETLLSVSGSFEVNSVSVTAKDMTASSILTDSSSSDIIMTIGSIDVTGMISYPSKIKYPLTVSLEGSEISVSSKDSTSASVGKASFKVSTKYDGIDRYIDADVKGLEYSAVEQASDDGNVTVTKISVESADVSCYVPFAKMWPEGLKIGSDTSYTVTYLGDMDFKLEGKNICYEKGGEKNVKTADLLKIESKSIFGSNAPYVESFSIEGEKLDFQDDSFTADSISGYVKNYGEDKENFRIDKKGDDRITIALDSVKQAIKIVKGSADFSAGTIPFSISVGKDVSFKAAGVSALNFYFENGAVLSGTVSMDTSEDKVDNGETRVIMLGDIAKITLSPFGDNLGSAGYKLTYDIGTMTSGTLTACKGTTIPEWKSDYGLQWVRSDDKMSATFSVPENGASFRFETVPDTFTFAYDGGEPAEKKYKETIELEALPDKIGFKAVGWNDGSSTFVPGKDTYSMPARNVVLTPVYADATPVVEEKDKDISVKSETSSSIIVKNDTISKIADGGSLIINVVGGEIKMGKETIDGLRKEAGSGDLNLLVSVSRSDNIDDAVKEKIVGNGALYNIGLMTEEGKVFDYTQSETFEVSLNVKVSGKVDHFKITYLGDDYNTHEVGVSGFSQSDDNNCNVSFQCNHFSDYIIEPVYKSGTDWVLIVAIVVIAVLVIAAITFFVIRAKSKTKTL